MVGYKTGPRMHNFNNKCPSNIKNDFFNKEHGPFKPANKLSRAEILTMIDKLNSLHYIDNFYYSSRNYYLNYYKNALSKR